MQGEFTDFWQRYPRHVGRAEALKAFAKARLTTDLDTLMQNVFRYAEERKGEEDRFTLHASTWLNQRRWEDEPPSNVIPMTRRFAGYQQPQKSMGDQAREIAARWAAEEAENARKQS
jgi:hypothetical protein